MSAFLRRPTPLIVARARGAGIVSYFASERNLAQVIREQDPFGVADPCPMNAGGPHQPIMSGSDLVCPHCAKVFWQ